MWGLGSMGAIRAAEMQELGVRGYGAVFRMFVEQGLTDDEVALLHSPAPPYFAATEPLVHLRRALESFVANGALTETDALDISKELSGMWFGYRTLELFGKMMSQRGVRCLFRNSTFDAFRVKCHDLFAFLEERPWER